MLSRKKAIAWVQAHPGLSAQGFWDDQAARRNRSSVRWSIFAILCAVASLVVQVIW